jgi:hypothetical protein
MAPYHAPAAAGTAEWASFKRTFSRSYTSAEEPARLRAFHANLVRIARGNAERAATAHADGPRLGVTPFADLTPAEFSAQRRRSGGVGRGGVAEGAERRSLGAHRWRGESLPASVDWQAAGATTPIADENQHGCLGACWAFSAAGALEGAHKLQSGRLVALSEQQFMDCIGTRSAARRGPTLF